MKLWFVLTSPGLRLISRGLAGRELLVCRVSAICQGGGPIWLTCPLWDSVDGIPMSKVLSWLGKGE